MKSLLIIFLLISNFTISQNPDYFNKGREYHYNALYINAHGDTITKEKIILKPKGRPWIGQPRVQTAIQYIFLTDTAGYRNYLKPDSSLYKKYPNDKERLDRHYKKQMNRELKIKQQQTTGATQKYGFFYMHPPRTNQYSILFNSAHPIVFFNALNDSVNVFTRTLGLPFVGDYNQEYTVTPINDTTINGEKIKAWSVFADSKGDEKVYAKEQDEYNSTLDAIFTYEYGFIKMHYAFVNGVKVHFDFEKMAVL